MGSGWMIILFLYVYVMKGGGIEGGGEAIVVGFLDEGMFVCGYRFSLDVMLFYRGVWKWEF